MLSLTKTESIIVEALRSGPKSRYDLEEMVDHGKDYSDSFIKVLIHNINRKAGKTLVEGFNEGGFYKYRLLDDRIDFQIAKGIEGVLMEIKEMRVMDKAIKCELCKYKVDHDNRRKLYFIIGAVSAILLILVFILGYNIGWNQGVNNGNNVLELDKSVIDQIKSMTGTN